MSRMQVVSFSYLIIFLPQIASLPVPQFALFNSDSNYCAELSGKS